MNPYAQILREERKRLGLTQSDVANACQLSRVAITQYENGSNTPSLAIIEPLARLGFNIPLILGFQSNLLGGSTIDPANHEFAKRIVTSLPNMTKLPTKELNFALDSYLSVLIELSSSSKSISRSDTK